MAARHVPGLTLWRNSSGVAETANGGKQRFGVGSPGGADLIGILAPRGTLCAIEVKKHDGCVSKEQELFLQLVRRSGGIAFVARSVEDFLLGMKPYVEGK